METIKSYLDNIFKTLPQTEEVAKLKVEMLSDMEAKYQELREEGLSENEAIGKVIGEFGNIDELLEEMGIVSEKEGLTIVSLDEAREVIASSVKSNFLVGIGVSIILMGVALFLMIAELYEEVAVAILLGMIIPAVGLFIYAGFLKEKFESVETGKFALDMGTEATLKEEAKAVVAKNIVTTIIGVSLCIFSVVVFMLVEGFSGSSYVGSVSVLLSIQAIAVFVLIAFSGRKNAYDKLLKKCDFCEEKKHESKLVQAVAAFVWPLAVCIFLIWGFIFDGWRFSWIVFPVTGLLFGAFAGIINILNKK